MAENHKQVHIDELRANYALWEHSLAFRGMRPQPICNETQGPDVLSQSVLSPSVLFNIPIKIKNKNKQKKIKNRQTNKQNTTTKCLHCVKQEPLWTKSMQISGNTQWRGPLGLKLSYPALLSSLLRAKKKYLRLHTLTMSVL